MDRGGSRRGETWGRRSGGNIPLSPHLTMRWCVHNCWFCFCKTSHHSCLCGRPAHCQHSQLRFVLYRKASACAVVSAVATAAAAPLLRRLLLLLLALLLLLPTPLLPPLLLWGLVFLLLAPLPLALLLLQMLGLLQALLLLVLLAPLLPPLLPPLLLLPPGAPIPDCWP